MEARAEVGYDGAPTTHSTVALICTTICRSLWGVGFSSDDSLGRGLPILT